ncbi:MAG: pyridoxamine 5'-phosphate oxidase family protein [Kiritimatiellae bacterium]|nr:pyridoxamine 5'-phosphate oxidase family protein [Kiritimatiellia bacterium]
MRPMLPLIAAFAVAAATVLAETDVPPVADASAEPTPPPQETAIMRIDKLFSQANAFFLATVDGDQPKLRPLGAHHVVDGVLWFGVGEFKNVYRQLAANPKCEFVALTEGGKWLRYTGRAVFAEGAEREKLEEVFLEAAPGLRAIYDQQPGHRMMCFQLADARAELIPMMPPGEILLDEAADAADAWDKVFPQSDKVAHSKVSFRNRFGILLVADLYAPKDAPAGEKLPAIAVSGPFGAVKEQSSGLYAQTLAERGFLTLAFDPSFTGESGGYPRYVASPDLNTEDFLAAVDFLATRPDVDAERIGIVGICGWGGLALNAAALDPRIKATVATTMYDMSRVNQNGYFDQGDSEESRHALREAQAAQRTADFAAGGQPPRAGGVIDPLPDDAPQFVKDYHAYYKTPRGFHPRSLNSTDGWNKTGCQSFLNTKLLAFAAEIRAPVLILHGENAHSRYFGETAFKQMTENSPFADNKELLIIPGASHCDLYDGGESGAIPWDKLADFFRQNLK